MKKNTITIEELLYYAFFCILLFAKGIGLYDGQTVFKGLLVVAMLCWMGKMAASRYTVKEILLIGLFLALGGITYIKSGEKGILLFTMMFVGMKNIAIEKIMRMGLWAWGSSFLLLTFTSLWHMQDMGYKVHDKLGLGYIFRYGLGYSHPNVLHVSYFIFVIFIVYVCGKNYGMKAFALLMLGNLLTFSYSVSYTGVAIVTLYLLTALYMAKKQKLHAWEKILCNLVYPGCCLLSLWGSVLLKNHEQIFRIINKIVNERLRLSQIFLVKENISLFGVRVADLITASLTMDNAYVYLFITHGIIIFAVISVLYLYLIYVYAKENRARELTIIVFICLMGIMEPYLFNTSFKNVIFLFVGELFYRKWIGTEKVQAVRTVGVDGWIRLCRKEVAAGEKISRKAATIKSAVAAKKKTILCCSILAGVIVAGATGITSYSQMPPGYIITRNQTGIIDENYFYMGDNWQETYPSYQAVGSISEDTPVNAFDGTIVQVEVVRSCLNGFVIGSVLAAIMWCGICVVKQPKEK